MKMAKMSGAKALLESPERQNVEVIFGILGGAILPVYDAFCTHPKSATSSPATNNARRTRRTATHEPAGDQAYASPPAVQAPQTS